MNMQRKNAPKKGSAPKNPQVQRRSAPVAKASVIRNSGPRQREYLPNGDCRIAHREYFNDLTSPGAAFNVSQYRINPGLANVFPWLSGIAPNWESYTFEKLEFHFETEQATTAVGTVILAVDYDAADDAPDSKSDVMSYRGAVRTAPWTPCCHRSLREDLVKGMKDRYVRIGTLASNLDIKTYDVGALYVCTQGQASTSTLGELYVDYIVVLKTPQTGSNTTLSKKITGGSSLAASDLTGTSPTLEGSLPLTNSSASTVTFGADWEGIVQVVVVGTTLANPFVLAGTATSATLANSDNVNSTSTKAVLNLRVQATVAQTLTVTLTSAASVTSCVWRFSEYDYALA